MDSIKKSALTFIVVSFLAVFALLIVSFSIYHSSRIDEQTVPIGSLRNALIFTRALAGSLSFLPPAVIFILVNSFSLFFTLSPFQKESFPFNSIAVPSFVMLILFLTIITVSEFFFVPLLWHMAENISHTSQKAQAALVHAQQLYEKGDNEGVLEILDLYFEVDERNVSAQNLYTRAFDDLSQRRLTETEEHMKIEELSTGREPSYYEQGKAEYERENYYAALFYLERALSLHRDNQEIQELYKRCKSKAVDQLGEITRKEKEQKRLIEEKEQALTALDNGAIYEAYRIFSQLSKRYPNLEDLSLYLMTVKERLSEIDFLPEELREHEWLPSVQNVVFIDKAGFVNTVEKIVPNRGTFYFYNISRYRKKGGSAGSTNTMYGKWMGERILIKNAEVFEEISEEDEELRYIYPFVNPEYLVRMDPDIERQLTIYERISVSEDLKRSGLDIEGRHVWLSEKFGILFSVYVLSLFIGAMGWKRRSIYDFPSVFKLILYAAVAPFVVYLIFRLYVGMNAVLIYSHRYFTRLVSGRINLIVFIILINTVIGIFATFYFLSQGSAEE